MMRPQSLWEIIKGRGHPIKCYVLSENRNVITHIQEVCRILAIDCDVLPTDIDRLPVDLTAENLRIVKDMGFVVMVLDIPSLGESALILRNYWRYNPTTVGLPFLYLVDATQLPKEFDALQGYDEIRLISEDGSEIQMGIQTVIYREDYYRKTRQR